MGPSSILARFASELKFDDIPADVVEVAKLCLLDTIGVGLAASGRPWSVIVADVVEGAGGAGTCTIWGRAERTSVQQAALVNGTSAHGIEMDDRQPREQMHAGAMLVPAALAACEYTGASGRDLLASVVCGYEVGMRVGAALRIRRGIHGPGHKGVWSAVAAAGRALGLSPEAMSDAFGIAGSMASGLIEFSHDPRGTMVKRVHGGLAAHHGVLAALLASRGLTGPATVLEGPDGYLEAYGEPGQPTDLDALTAGLGTSWVILRREVKPYSSWGGSHNLVDALAQLMTEPDVHARSVTRIVIRGSSRLIYRHEQPRPMSIMAAQYSLPFLAGVVLTRGHHALMDPDALWTDELLGDPAILAIADRVELGIDPELDEVFRRERHYGGARVTVTLNDGTERHVEVRHSKGTYGNPVTPEEIEAKFRMITRRSLGELRAAELSRLIHELDRVDDVRAVTALLGSRPH